MTGGDMTTSAAEYVEVEGLGMIPVWNLQMMSDEREKELGRESAAKWKEDNAT